MTKTVLITGIGKGIGKALAEKFLKEGWFVIGSYYTNKPLERDNFAAYQLDLSSSHSIDEFVQTVRELEKKISILVNNAGVLIDEEETKVIAKKLRDTLEINLVGTIELTERLLPYMEEESHVINISSTAGSLELAGGDDGHYPHHYPAYKISKAAINMYTRTLSTVVPKGIIVSSVHPGWVRTEMGGDDADIAPEEAADNLYNFSTTRPETGEFWYKGRRIPW